MTASLIFILIDVVSFSKCWKILETILYFHFKFKVDSPSASQYGKKWYLKSLRRSHSDGVTCLQFNDFYIVSGSYDKTVKLWDFTVC